MPPPNYEKVTNQDLKMACMGVIERLAPKAPHPLQDGWVSSLEVIVEGPDGKIHLATVEIDDEDASDTLALGTRVGEEIIRQIPPGACPVIIMYAGGQHGRLTAYAVCIDRRYYKGVPASGSQTRWEIYQCEGFPTHAEEPLFSLAVGFFSGFGNALDRLASEMGLDENGWADSQADTENGPADVVDADDTPSSMGDVGVEQFFKEF